MVPLDKQELWETRRTDPHSSLQPSGNRLYTPLGKCQGSRRQDQDRDSHVCPDLTRPHHTPPETRDSTGRDSSGQGS